MTYATFKSSPKTVIQSSDIGPGQINIEHLSPELFSEIRSISQHAHTGSKSRRITASDITGYFGIGGFYMYSSDGTKKYKVTINSGTGAFVLTEV